MAHGVWADVFGDAGHQGIVRDEPLDTSGGEPMKIAASIDCFAAAIPHEKRFGGVGAFV